MEGVHWFVQVYSHQTKAMSLGRTTLICIGIFTSSKSDVALEDYIDLYRCIHTKQKWHGRSTLICTGVFTPSKSDMEGVHWFVQVYSHQAKVTSLWKDYINLCRYIHTKQNDMERLHWFVQVYSHQANWCHLEGLLWFVKVYSHQAKWCHLEGPHWFVQVYSH